MLDLSELRQLVVFAECGRLSKAADMLYLSQPTMTRSMQHLEEEFGVPLFERTKNSIGLNATGKMAVEQARMLLREADKAVSDVRDFDRKQHTLSIVSCAPAPLWDLLPQLARLFPAKTMSSSIKTEQETLAAIKNEDAELAVLTEELDEDGFISFPFLEEKLSVCLPPDHPLSGHAELTFSQINGYNFLLAENLGFWDSLCREKMPASRFHVQTSELAMRELIEESTLPCFVTDLSDSIRGYSIANRVIIPITDPEANVTYYLTCKKENEVYAKAFRR